MDKDLQIFKTFSPKGTALEKRTGAVIYTRVSSKEQFDNNASLETQLKYCQLYASKRGFSVSNYFGGTYESAKTDERKEFTKMLKYVKANPHIGYIIVYSFERFSRTGSNGMFITDQLKRQGVLLCSATQEVDSTTSAGSLQQDMFFVFSKYDNDLRRDKCVAGMREKLRKGHIVGAVPFGYTNMNPGNGKTPDLQINQYGELLKRAFMLKANHDMTYEEIVQHLIKHGWSKPSKKLGDLFRNPFYCGILVNGHLPGEVIVGKHPALISRDVFLKVNNIIEKNVKGKKYSTDDENLPLKQFVHSAAHGTPYTGYIVRRKGLYYYKCNAIGTKENRSAKQMHELFKMYLKQFELVTKDIVEPIKDAMLEVCIELQKESMDNAIALEAQLTKIENNLNTIERRYVLGEVDSALYDKYKAEFDNELSRIKEEIGNCTFNLSNLENALERAIGYALDLPALWESADLEEKRRIQNIVFPEGIAYDFQNHCYRTERVNVLFKAIPVVAGIIGGKKKEAAHINNVLPQFVESEGIEPSSKQRISKLSTCLFPDWFSSVEWTGTPRSTAYVLKFRGRLKQSHQLAQKDELLGIRTNGRSSEGSTCQGY
jgi:site-specific DNA recombinase